MSRILLYHDTFLMKGGAERMNIEIAKILGADIATAVWKPECYDARSMGFDGAIFEVNPGFRKGMLGFLKMKWRFFRSVPFRFLVPRQHLPTSGTVPESLPVYGGMSEGQGGFDIHNYDTVFFSNEAITGIWNIKPGTRTYYYAHSISRHLFDLSDQYLAKVPWYAKVPYQIMAYLLRKLYIAEVRNVDVIFVNSLKNKERMGEWFGRDDAIVLYPPVDTSKFKMKDSKGKIMVPDNFASETRLLRNLAVTETSTFNLPTSYFLSFSRLTHAKRVDVIIEAFKSMPEKNLLILYGEHDSQKEEFMELAGINIPPGSGYRELPGEGEMSVGQRGLLEILVSEKFPNITFLKLENNEDLPAVISGATATIAISREEDFGMVAIESMACGVPVVAVDEGGYRETVIDGKTGRLVHGTEYMVHGTESQEQKEALKTALIEVIKHTEPEEWKAMQDDCIARAGEFSLGKFRERIASFF